MRFLLVAIICSLLLSTACYDKIQEGNSSPQNYINQDLNGYELWIVLKYYTNIQYCRDGCATVIGDSNTFFQYWSVDFGFQICNRSFISRTIPWVTDEYDNVIVDNPRIIHIMIGSNDVNVEENPEDIIDNYETMLIEYTQDNIPIVVTNILPQYGVHEDNNPTIEYLNDEIEDLCLTYGVTYIDQYSNFIGHSEYYNDALHIKRSSFQQFFVPTLTPYFTE